MWHAKTGNDVDVAIASNPTRSLSDGINAGAAPPHIEHVLPF